MLEKSKGRGQTRSPGPPGWRLSVRLVTLTLKKQHAIETETRKEIMACTGGRLMLPRER